MWPHFGPMSAPDIDDRAAQFYMCRERERADSLVTRTHLYLVRKCWFDPDILNHEAFALLSVTFH